MSKSLSGVNSCWRSGCLQTTPRDSMRPQLLLMESRISERMDLGGNLACPKASSIFPLELLEPGEISLVFQTTQLCLREWATGMVLQSRTTKSLLRQTVISRSDILCFHFSLSLYLKVNSTLELLMSMLQMKSRGIFSGLKVSVRSTQSITDFDLNPSGVLISYSSSEIILQGIEFGVILFDTNFGLFHTFSFTSTILASCACIPSTIICPCWYTSFTLSFFSSRDSFSRTFSLIFSPLSPFSFSKREPFPRFLGSFFSTEACILLWSKEKLSCISVCTRVGLYAFSKLMESLLAFSLVLFPIASLKMLFRYLLRKFSFSGSTSSRKIQS